MLLMGATAGWTSRRLRLLGEPAVRSCSHECSHAAQAWHHCPLLASMPAASRPHCHELFACKVLMALLLCVPGPAGLQAALRLYRGSGFAQHGEELPPAEEGQGGWLGGSLTLLCRPAAGQCVQVAPAISKAQASLQLHRHPPPSPSPQVDDEGKPIAGEPKPAGSALLPALGLLGITLARAAGYLPLNDPLTRALLFVPLFTLLVMRLHRQTVQGSKGLSGVLSHPLLT